MFRLLALLQLTRAALAFTAVADAWTVLLLRYPVSELSPNQFRNLIARMVVTGVVSIGLYGFGMALNDLLDARHDRVFAPRRPIPSGRIRVRTAAVLCLLLVMSSLLAAAFLSVLTSADRRAEDPMPWPFFFAMGTALLIVLYDATSKYLGAFGLVTLGAIRALHCLIGNPKTDLLFLSMILLTHVIVVSTVAYVLENKRPRLNRFDYIFIAGGLFVGNGLALWRMMARGAFVPGVERMLIGPAIAAAIYAAWAAWVLLDKERSPRQKGERIMLMGLFWLFVYDASMLLSNGQFLAGLAVILLLLCAVGSFFGLRFLGRTLGAAKPDYRAASADDVPGSA